MKYFTNFIKNNKETIILISIAYLFSVLLRFIWIYQFNDFNEYKFHNQLMINTNDGYYWAEGARDIINGFHQQNDRSPIDSAISILTATFYKILPFSFESIILYMSVFLSSLIVIPIFLVGKILKDATTGFIAALIGSIAWSYYNRTMAGYYDTDMLNIVLPTFLLWSLIYAIKTNEEKFLFLSAIEIILYRWWYPQSYSLEFSFWSIIFLYFLYLKFYKKDENKASYFLLLLTFMLFSMIYIDGRIRFLLVLALYVGLKQKKEFILKNLYYIFYISIFLFLISGGLNPIFHKLKSYVFKEKISQNDNLHFFTVMQTIREASAIPFEVFAKRISGSVIVFILSIIGYIWLIFKNRVLLISLPMIGLGFLAYKSGLRFTIYAVPIFAISIAFLINEITSLIKNKYIKYTLSAIFSLLVLYPNIKHIISYKVPPVFLKSEVLVLDKLKHIASREDYVVAWWDYGYPIRYYSDVKTLIDGGKHSGALNFPISFALTKEQNLSAKMMRLDTEYEEKRFVLQEKNDTKKIPTNIALMMKDYHFNNPNKFLSSLNNLKLPKKTRDIYLYLPHRMINIYSTIELFSNLDLATGKQKTPSFFYKTNNFKENRRYLSLGNNILFDKQNKNLIIGNKAIPIRKFSTVFYNKNKKLQKQEMMFNPFGSLNIIFMPNYSQILVVDNKTYNSTYFQLFIFENYDKNLFEPVILTPLAKVYRLKI